MSLYADNASDNPESPGLGKPGLSSSYIAFDDLRDLTEVAGAIVYVHTGYLGSWSVLPVAESCPWIKRGLQYCCESEAAT